jgi:4-methyl-5(b-hydroxyethyl)-thiazole monophosphate biosynthesis
MPGARNLDEDPFVDRFLAKAGAEDTILAAICAAPMILGKRGLLAARRATCYPGFEADLRDAVVTGGRVESDGRRITGCGMGASVEFGLALCRALLGDEAAEKIRAGILAP